MSPWILLLIAFLVLDLVLVVVVYWRRARMRQYDAKSLQYIKSHWIRVIDTFPGNPAGAVIDADKILDYAMGKQGFQGSVGEKLKKAGPRFSDLNGVWRAHKLRNKLAHELGGVDVSEAKSALKQFKRALNDLGAGL